MAISVDIPLLAEPVTVGPLGLTIALLIYSLIISGALSDLLRGLWNKVSPKILFYWKKVKYGKKTAEEVQGEVEEALDEEELKDITLVDKPGKAGHWDEVNLTGFHDEEELSEHLSRHIPEQVVYRDLKKHLLKTYKRGFELALAARIAKKQGHDGELSKIGSKAEEEDVVYEYELFDDIISDEEKLEVFKNEAKRREEGFQRGTHASINEDSKEEFCDIIDRLTGDSKIVVVKHPDDYIRSRDRAKKFLGRASIDTVFILGRGDGTISKINDIKEDLQKEFDVDLVNRGTYNWETEYGEHYGKVIALAK